MDAQFIDRLLKCSDCHGEFIFTAGEQLFFQDKQFKNDPKRCKPCKSRRSGLAAAANGTGPAAAGLSRTETRTTCSECSVDTTVPFKPTQGRPVLCRQCFQARNRAAPAMAAAVQAPAALELGLPAMVCDERGHYGRDDLGTDAGVGGRERPDDVCGGGAGRGRFNGIGFRGILCGERGRPGVDLLSAGAGGHAWD